MQISFLGLKAPDFFRDLNKEKKLTFEVIPAIDIRGGFCVRLFQGDYEQETRYNLDPVEVAKQWELEGAGLLHVVDLDGAKLGNPVNSKIISEICSAVKLPVEVSGGIRDPLSIADAFKMGANLVQLGSAAVKDLGIVKEAVAKHSSAITVALDIREGNIYVDGWRKKAENSVGLDPINFAIELADIGVRRLMVTDISRDGALEGVNLDLMANFVEQVEIPVIASGGVSSIEDILSLSQIGCEGVVVGKALYEKIFSISDVKVALKNAN